MSNPFDLNDQDAYRRWRDDRLAGYPATVEDLRVAVANLALPTGAEIKEVKLRVDRFNLALVVTVPDQIAPDGILSFGFALGLRTADSNLFADRMAVSTITPRSQAADQRGEYIPYTNKPLSWHTDGYYNDAEGQVGAWMLFCLRPAQSGGHNSFLDPEILYIRLRDQSPDHIRALSHRETLTIPANIQDHETIRPASQGPVFSVRAGRLHLRYTARGRHAIWRDTPDTTAAREALDRLLSAPSIYTFTHGLGAGEGVVSNNVLHNRSAFSEGSHGADEAARLLYRVRYLERIGDVSPSLQDHGG